MLEALNRQHHSAVYITITITFVGMLWSWYPKTPVMGTDAECWARKKLNEHLFSISVGTELESASILQSEMP